MIKTMNLIALLLTLHLPLAACAHVGDVSQNTDGRSVPDVQEMQEKSQEDACDCCQKCKAARRSVKPDLHEKKGDENGCGDCCKKCGRPVQPAPEEIPPEIIQKPRQK